jgi:hypothetical protein
MKFVNSYSKENIKGLDSEESIYDITGNIAQSNEEKVFAKMVTINLGKKDFQRQFFVRAYNNLPFDPMGPDARRDIWRRTELKKVNESTFNFYLTYLQTKNSIYMTRTQRSFING